jgi:hypothetical protein
MMNGKPRIRSDKRIRNYGKNIWGIKMVSEEKEITDEDILNACEVIRKSYLRLDESVMPLKERLNNAQYYGKLRFKLLVLVKMSQAKSEKKQ